MSKVPGLKSVSECLLTELKKRFAYMFLDTELDFDCAYLSATMLDPYLKPLIPVAYINTINRNFFKCIRWMLETKSVIY